MLIAEGKPESKLRLMLAQTRKNAQSHAARIRTGA